MTVHWHTVWRDGFRDTVLEYRPVAPAKGDAPWTRLFGRFEPMPFSDRLVVIDPELASIRISAAFRSDNIEGFVHLLEAGFGARVERRGESEIFLRKRPASPNPD